MSEFSKSRIYAFNSQIFSGDGFLEVYVSDRPNPIGAEPYVAYLVKILRLINLLSTIFSVQAITNMDAEYPSILHNNENSIINLPSTSFSIQKISEFNIVSLQMLRLFPYSNARKLSSNKHQKRYTKILSDIPKKTK